MGRGERDETSSESSHISFMLILFGFALGLFSIIHFGGGNKGVCYGILYMFCSCLSVCLPLSHKPAEATLGALVSLWQHYPLIILLNSVTFDMSGIFWVYKECIQYMTKQHSPGGSPKHSISPGFEVVERISVFDKSCCSLR